MESEQIQAESAPTAPPPAEPDFARIAQEAPQPTLAERLGAPALAWGGALVIAALLSLGALWLRNERDVNQAMEVVAGSTRADAPAAQPVAAAPAASSVPPLVVLPPQQDAKAAPPPATAAAITTAAPAPRPAIAQPAARTAVPRLAAKAPRPAAKAPRTDTRVAARPVRRAPAVVVNDKPVTHADLNVAVAQRCKTGDLARECLASLCREGKKGDAACQALSNLDH